jgi:hypothetical protein
MSDHEWKGLALQTAAVSSRLSVLAGVGGYQVTVPRGGIASATSCSHWAESRRVVVGGRGWGHTCPSPDTQPMRGVRPHSVQQSWLPQPGPQEHSVPEPGALCGPGGSTPSIHSTPARCFCHSFLHGYSTLVWERVLQVTSRLPCCIPPGGYQEGPEDSNLPPSCASSQPGAHHTTAGLNLDQPDPCWAPP